MIRLAFVAVFAALLAGPALAQSIPNQYNAVGLIGRDSASGLPCYIGGASTCGIPGTGGGGGGGAATIADGADVAQGATTDATCAGDNTSGCTVEQRLQRIAQRVTSLITAVGTPYQAGGVQGLPAATTPAAGTASAIGTGGTAVTLVTGPVNGCTITNPLLATDQNIATAEVAYINGVTTATANGRGTNNALQPGQTWNCIPGQTTNVSVIATTANHALSVVKW